MNPVDLKKEVMSKGFLALSYNLVKSLGLREALVLSELLSKNVYCSENGKLQKDGSFYCTQPDLASKLGYSKGTISKSISILEEKGFLSIETRILPNQNKYNFYILNTEKILEAIGTEVEGVSDSTDSDSYLADGVSDLDHRVRELRFNNNINNKENKKEIIQKDKQADAVSVGQNTLFNLPLVSKEKKKETPTTFHHAPKTHRGMSERKIAKAVAGDISWEEVNWRDLTCFYESQHNKRFSKAIRYEYGTQINQVSSFLQKNNISKEEACDVLVGILDIAQLTPKTVEFGCLSFNSLQTFGQEYLDEYLRRKGQGINQVQLTDTSIEPTEKVEYF